MDNSFKQTYETITASEKFKTFKKEHPDAELVAGFFILDFLSNDTKKSMDYLDGEEIFTFDLADDGYIKQKQDKLINPESNDKLKLTKITHNPKIEVDELKSIVGEKKLERGISAHLHKIIAVLQNSEEKQIWNLTCMLDQLIILHVLISAETGEILKFERKSMMDFVRKVK
jgi:hypothetical protein